MKTGLVSVTFRRLTIDEIIILAAKAGIDGIEWGGDVHCPPDDLKKISEAAAKTKASGLEVASYGSYYKIGVDDNFGDILAAARTLDAPNIRCWAGNTGSRDASIEYRDRVVEDARKIADIAEDAGISVSFEYHGQTLTDTQESTVKLLQEVDRKNIFTYWQPLFNTGYTENLANISELSALNKLKNIHAYQWEGCDSDSFVRKPFAEGKSVWLEYLQRAKAEYILLEFVKDDSEEQFFEDARVLIEIVANITPSASAHQTP